MISRPKRKTKEYLYMKFIVQLLEYFGSKSTSTTAAAE